MKDFIKSLGGAGWAAFLGLSAVVTVVAAFNLPVYVDTTNPWVLLGAGAILFPIAFANGWKQRGFRNERDIHLADELEKERAADKEKSRVAIAQIQADKELELERLKHKYDEDREKALRERDEAKEAAEAARRIESRERMELEEFKNLSAEEKLMVLRLYDNRSVKDMLWPGAEYEYPDLYDYYTTENLVPIGTLYRLTNNKRALIDAHPELLEQARQYVEERKREERGC